MKVCMRYLHWHVSTHIHTYICTHIYTHIYTHTRAQTSGNAKSTPWPRAGDSTTYLRVIDGQNFGLQSHKA